MLLKSSSTSFLGSLLPSYSESPNNHSEFHNTPKHASSSSFHQSCKLSSSNGGSQNLNKSLLGSPSVSETRTSQNGVRRVQSEGNLEELAHASYNVDEFTTQYSKKIAKKPNFSCLETIPSFSHHRLGTAFENGYSDEEFEEESDEEMEVEEKGYSFRAESFDFEDMRKNMNGYGTREGKMCLASGIGIYGDGFVDGGGYGGSGGGGSYKPVAFNRDGGQNGQSMEEYYKRMLEGNPGNPLFLRNYAQFLYQKKRDLRGAEEYYSRAILADPADGEILSQYAKLIWELHHDRERAANYFERAIEASSEDSHIHAAYANFLWGIDDEEEDDIPCVAQPLLHHGVIASATA